MKDIVGLQLMNLKYINVEDENDLKKYHQITLQRAKEIEEAYYKKYINIP